MIKRNLTARLSILIASAILLCFSVSASLAQTKDAPLKSEELVKLIYQLPKQPGKKDEVIEEIRRRGLGFALTEGMRSLVASKSGNDPVLRRTLEEAERRRLNPVASSLPPTAESLALLEKSRVATLEAAQTMPDFVVKQLISRSYSRGGVNNWLTSDRLTVAVSYRANEGEEYKLLAINGLPTGADAKEGQNSYEQAGGTSSTGEYVSMLTALFAEESKANIQMVDTDLLRGRRTIVYEFEVRKDNSRQTIKTQGRTVTVGYRGKIWVDRENYRILRMENISTEIPTDFPVTAGSSMIDYDWVTIAEQTYLLPSRAEIKLTGGLLTQSIQTRNLIRFRDYQKYGTEVKIIEEDIVEDVPEEKP